MTKEKARESHRVALLMQFFGQPLKTLVFVKTENHRFCLVSLPFFPFRRLPLDGSHEPPVVMTKEKVRKSHRLASLMPKGVVFRTVPTVKLWLTLLLSLLGTRMAELFRTVGYLPLIHLHLLYKTHHG